MGEFKCAFCGRLLGRQNENGYQIEGYYLFFDKAYCLDCWESGRYKDISHISINQNELSSSPSLKTKPVVS